VTSPSAGAAISVLISPPPASWPPVIRSPATEAKAFRHELGLAVDHPIVMSGHQAGFWHSGIAAKWIAAQVAAKRYQGSAAWLTVDQDINDAVAIRIPTRTSASNLGGNLGGNLGEVTWRLDASTGPINDRPTAFVPSFDPAPFTLPSPLAGTTTAAGLTAISEALKRCQPSPSAAAQLATAATALLAEWTNLPACPQVMATALATTTAFAAIIDAMKRDLARCVQTYNAAARSVRAPGIGSLRGSDLGADNAELPLWSLDRQTGLRRPVTIKTLTQVPIADLAPKALLMTGLVRHLGCDLFIHGTGGGASDAEGGYDKVAERWLASWLGWTLAPSVVVSATMRLDLATGPVVTDDDVNLAAMHIHRARHTPSLLGDDAAQLRKRELLLDINKRGLSRSQRDKPFRALHALLATVRTLHANALTARQAKLADLSAARDRDLLAADRTWPFPLHGPERIADLASDLRAKLAASH